MLRFAAVLFALFWMGGVAMAQPFGSRITAVEVQQTEAAGTYSGVGYVRIRGVVRGEVDTDEPVVKAETLPVASESRYAYSSAFELIVPAQGQPANAAVYVDTENRGSAISQGSLGGFLQNHRISYARVQWQAGISPGVPQTVQGVGLAIMRDFGRWLGGKAPAPKVSGGFVPPPHAKLMIGGISQSAWTVNTLIAEGFNADPVTGKGVFDAALAVDGIGYWLAINQLGAKAGVAQTPYIVPDGVPLQRTELLTRPASDPLYVDIANYSDFYRLRAGLTSVDFTGPKFRRYDFPSPHAVGTAQSGARCNGGQPITFHTLRYAPYMRAIVLGMFKEIGVASAKDAKPLPPSRVFTLTGAPPASPTFNGLPGVLVRVPATQNGWPVGGVRFPEAMAPLGDIDPPAVGPAVTTSIAETCGNFSGFKPYGLARVTGLYRSKEAWLAGYAQTVDRLVAEGFLLPEDKAAMVEAAGKTWPE